MFLGEKKLDANDLEALHLFQTAIKQWLDAGRLRVFLDYQLLSVHCKRKLDKVVAIVRIEGVLFRFRLRVEHETRYSIREGFFSGRRVYDSPTDQGLHGAEDQFEEGINLVFNRGSEFSNPGWTVSEGPKSFFPMDRNHLYWLIRSERRKKRRIGAHQTG